MCDVDNRLFYLLWVIVLSGMMGLGGLCLALVWLLLKG